MVDPTQRDKILTDGPIAVNLFILNGEDRCEEKRWDGEAGEASPLDQLPFQVGFRLSKKALRPSRASLVFINLSR